MAKELDPLKLSSPRIFLLRMLVFVVLGGLVAFLLHKQIEVAFMANPGLNSLIIGVLLIGIVLSLRQVIRLYPEIAWVNNFRLADPGLAVERPPVLLAPMAAILGSRIGRMAMSAQLMRGILDSIATRLDEARDISRYMTGLLVFLGLLGTFWGLIETVGSVGGVIQGLKAGGDAGSMFELAARRPRRAAFRHGHIVLVLAVRSRRLAGARLPRPAIEPGAEPLLHRTGGLALHHGLRPGRRADRGRRRHRRDALGHRPPARGDQRGRHQQGRLHRHVQSGRGDPGPGAPHAHRAADDPRLGRQPGRAAARDQAAAGDHGARKGRIR